MINLAGALLRSLRLILLIVLGRLYGVEWVGLYLLVYAIVDTCANLGIMGLDEAVLTHVARRRIDQDMDGVYHTIGQALWLGLAVTLLVTAALALLAPWLALAFFDKPELAPALRLMAWTLPFWTLSAVLLFATRALRMMQYEVLTKGAVEPAVILVLAVGFYLLDVGLVGLWVAVLVAAMAATGAAVYGFSRQLSLRRLWRGCFVTHGCWPLYRFAFPIGLVRVLNELLKRIDMFLVGRYLSADVLGIYGVAQEWAASIKKVRQAFNPIFVPVISASHQKQDYGGMLYQYRNVTRWILILDACILAAFVLAGRSLMSLFGADFIVGFPIVVVLALALAIHGVLGVSELFILIDKPWINVVNSAGALVVNCGLSLFLIPRYGMIGAAFAVLLLHAMLNSIRLLEVALLYHLQPFTPYHARALFAFVVALGVVWRAQIVWGRHGTISDLGAVLVCWLLYFALLVLLGLAPEEKAVLERWRK